MRIATRLVLILGLTTTTVMVAYAALALEQREDLLREALARETETLARSAQIVANNALRDGRLQDLDRVLGRIADDPQTLVAAVVTADDRVLAGGPENALSCLRGAPGLRRDRGAAASADSAGARGWIDCDGGARWVTLPVRVPGDLVVLARRATVLERDLASSRRRILLTTLALAGAAAAAILLVLRRTLSAPLSQIMKGVRTLGGPNPPTPVTVPRSAGELRDLAVAFNEMAERLEGKRQALVKEGEERVGLERRLRSAETFAALGRIAGGLAHELGSPLNVIAMRAERIDEDVDISPDVRRHAGEIVAEVERIARLVQGLRHIARGHPLDPRPVDLAKVVLAAAEDARARADPAGVALHVEVDEPLMVEGDETLLRHAVGNLALNAIQALAGHTGEPHVWVRVERERMVGRVLVEDNGPGIPQEAGAWLFEPFFTTRDVGEGMGLGLAISQGIAEEHGGTLQLESREEGGTRAVLRLPLVNTTGSTA